MIKRNALELLEKQGKTKYWLYKQLGMSYQNFSRMINNETKSIRYENIEAMCSNRRMIHPRGCPQGCCALRAFYETTETSPQIRGK